MTERHASLDDAATLLAAGSGLAGLGGDALAFVLSQLAAEGRWLIVFDEEDRADQFLRAMAFFHPHPDRVLPYPSDDNRPYDGFSADPERVHQRILAAHRASKDEHLVVVTTIRALQLKVPHDSVRRSGTLSLEVGGRIDRDALATGLRNAGYLATARADAPGRYAVRGDLVDVWPIGNRSPIRIDLFDDEIESLRRLDARTLAAGKAGKRVTILPAAEERLDEPALDRALSELMRHVAEAGGEGTARRRQVVDEWKAGIRFSGLQDWLPALVPVVDPLTLFSGFRQVLVHPLDAAAAARDAEANALRRYQSLDASERPLVPPSARYVPAAAVLDALSGAHTIHEIATERAPDLGARPPDTLVLRGADLAPVITALNNYAQADLRVALVVKDDGRGTRLLDLLAPHGLVPEVAKGPFDLRRGVVSLLQGDLPRGFVAEESGWAFVPVSALFGAPRKAGADRAHALWDRSVSSSAQLKAGDPVVHRLHGVGLYRGLQRLEVIAGIEQDFAKLEYRDGDLMFLPVAALDQLSRYAAAHDDATPVLDKLGGQSWERRKGKVRDSLLGMAQELVALYARREVAVRPPHPDGGSRMLAFESRFPYQETPDQREAIAAIQDDLTRPYPMDRLVCGDVGFGKTEVAMRAAMRVVAGGRQVAVLCPTTVLAHQHLRTFRERFPDDVAIGMWSRFTTPAELEALKTSLATGEVHIVVGTTSLLGRGVRFADLGLVVIDEEHRFGVKQKDRLKRFRSDIDVLALSATPIPRTLQHALSGAREMSLITTPPPERLSVRTTLTRPSESRVRDAILAEMERGGQSWYVHNRVESIGEVAERVRTWVPEARVAVAHGQLEDAALERVLVDFVDNQYDVLVCTSIVESGVDLPNVNTMLVDRADLMGLAQLYQLRGRVGRADRRATCILLAPDDISTEAMKRLRVLIENQSLGAGFHIASADLEMRGGGNLLGASQSGHIDQVGYETWVRLLEDAVHHARGEADRERIDPEVEVPLPAFLPDALVPDTDDRLAWYRRIGEAQKPAEVERQMAALEAEMGELPEPARNLGERAIVRLLCRDLGILRCGWLKVRVALTLHVSSPLRGKRLAAVLARHPKRFALKDEDTVSVRFTPAEGERPLRYLRWVMSQLARVDE